jgi:hypothetical protein
VRLPDAKDLPVEKLALVFKDTTNSYKYYWFISLLDNIIQESKTIIPFEHIILNMIGDAWYPINYFKLSFGKQDQLSNSILDLQNTYRYPKDIKRQELIICLLKGKNEQKIKNAIHKLSRYVPYRFLSPWFAEITLGVSDSKKNDLIAMLANQYFIENKPTSLYRFVGNSIEMNPSWNQYLLIHYNILKGFSYWHLLNYLQKNNPNVPSISEKLFPPSTRLMTNAKIFWQKYFEKKRVFKCIYSNEILTINDYSIDHFLPWSYVAHDQLWNLVPVAKKINSAKGDYLPSIDYLEKFAEIQFDAFQIVSLILKEKYLEDYSILFNESITEIAKLDKRKFINILIENIKPLIQIAVNMGFIANWTWKK